MTAQDTAGRRLAERRAQLDEHGAAVDELVRELADDVDDLRGQEGWDMQTTAGAEDWASDRGAVFRALRRAHFDPAKAHADLLKTLSARVEHGLSGVIPPPPRAVFTLLSPSRSVDKLGHPVAVLCLREVLRDATGSLVELKDWLWWGLELVRRALHDYWITGRRGSGAEGAVLLVDAKGAGYRNMEVELLPTLFSVGHNSFPGLFESVYVVNAGWTHRVMWNNVVRRVLPRSAIDKVVFLESQQDVESVFELDQLPPEYGGEGEPSDPDAVLRRYSRLRPHSRPGSRTVSRTASRAPSRAASREGRRHGPSRSTSNASMADLFYTAPGTPSSSSRPGSRAGSRPPSRKGSQLALSGLGAKLAMTKPGDKPLMLETSAIQRIKSLSDFHLYLSPSRLAHRDLLSDSEDDEPEPLPVIPIKRRTLRPALLEGGIAARRAASRLTPSPGGRAATPAEYATQLRDHHAKGLDKYCSDDTLSALGIESPSTSPTRGRSVQNTHGTMAPKLPTHATLPTAPDPGIDQGLIAALDQEQMAPPPSQPEAPAEDVQFSSANPWFGYPVVRVSNPHGGVSIRPRYGRNRKRDLVKTLLWLFLMRLQAWRDALERALGLQKLFAWRRDPTPRATPAEGLKAVAERRGYGPGFRGGNGKAVVKSGERDWVWMVIGFLLLRGTWAKLFEAPLEAAGLGGLRAILGLAG